MEFCTGNGIRHTAKNGVKYPGIGLRDIAALMADPDDVPKNDARWIIPSTYHAADAREHSAQQENGQFGAIVVDVDDGNHNLDEIKNAVVGAIGDVAVLIYATKSSTPEDRRWRVIIPRKTPLAWDSHTSQMRAVLALLAQQGIKGDPCATRAGQVAYLPNRGAHYEYYNTNGVAAMEQPAAVAAMEQQIRNDDARNEEAEKYIKAERAKQRAARPADDGENPTEWFNANNTVTAMLDRYGYELLGGDYRTPQSTSGSYAVRVFDDAWVSHSQTDYNSGLGVQAVSKSGGGSGFCWGDAFDLYVYYEHGNDKASAWRQLRREMPESSYRADRGVTPFSAPAFDDCSTYDVTNPPPIIKTTHPYLRFEPPETDEFTAPEFVLDGILVAGCAILAGGWGVGKTSQLIPLLSRAAHLCASDDPLKPLLRRRIVYITEDVEQVRQIMRGMRMAGELDGIEADEVADYFKVVSAARLKVEEIVKVAEPYARLAVVNHSAHTGVSRDAQALIVFDTRSACFSLDDESDNSEAGRVMATLRQGFPDNPLLIVGHIAKALKKADVSEMSGRGAGAWEADAQQVLYLVEKDGERWLDVAGPKHRFVASIDGIAFETVRSETTATDPLGNIVTMQLIHGSPKKVDFGQRAADRAAMAEIAERDERNALRLEVLTLAREMHKSGKGCNRAGLKKSISRRSTDVVEMIDELLDEQWLIEIPIATNVRRNASYAFYLFPPTASERDEYMKTWILPPAAQEPPRAFLKPIFDEFRPFPNISEKADEEG